jgi:ATP-binding cassette subfamily B protein
MKDQSQTQPKVTTWDVIKEYWKPSRRYIPSILFILFGVSLATIAQSVIAPTYYKKFFDIFSYGYDTETTAGMLTHVVIIIFGINMLSWIGYRISGFIIIYFEGNVMRDIRQKAFDYILDHSHSFFTNNFTGSLVQKINRFTRAFERLADRVFMDIIPLAIKIFGAGFVLSLIDKRIALVLLVWAFVFIFISYVFNRFKLKYDIEGAAVDSRATGALSDSISNHSSTQIFAGAESESKHFSIFNNDFLRIYTKRWNIAAVIDAVQALLNFAVEFFVFYYAIKYWQTGLVTLGIFALVQGYLIHIGGSLWGFGRIVRDLYEATADAKEMVEILHLPHEVQDVAHASRLSVTRGQVEFKNVSFAFGKGEQNKSVFNNLSISIKAGEKVALIGPSGTGKSTLVKLLLRLHDINDGEILIDGQNIATVTQNSLRENISLVPQDPALFHRSLMENIRYGKRNATDAEVIEASRLAHCDVFIKDFTQKYETFVGERGIKLSGGERQRVAIARALLKNAPILILDEATSSLDSHSESLIQDALNTLMKNRTTIVIAHRLSTIRKMDRIIVLGKEGVLEEGSHDQLIKSNGMYARLWNLQAGGFADRSIEEMLGEN